MVRDRSDKVAALLRDAAAQLIDPVPFGGQLQLAENLCGPNVATLLIIWCERAFKPRVVVQVFYM